MLRPLTSLFAIAGAAAALLPVSTATAGVTSHPHLTLASFPRIAPGINPAVVTHPILPFSTLSVSNADQATPGVPMVASPADLEQVRSYVPKSLADSRISLKRIRLRYRLGLGATTARSDPRISKRSLKATRAANASR